MKYNWVAIEREYGSGGDAIGRMVADKLGIPFYGREILQLAAKKSHKSVEELEAYEEKSTGSLIFSLFVMSQMSVGNDDTLPEGDKINNLEGAIIGDLYKEGPCVFVGRGAASILSKENKVLRVFIHADNETRAARAIENYGDNRETVMKKLDKMDKRRENFYHSFSQKSRWKGEDNYHLILDSGKLGIEECARIIADVMNKE